MTKEGQAYVRDMKFDNVPIGDYKIMVDLSFSRYIAINSTDSIY